MFEIDSFLEIIKNQKFEESNFENILVLLKTNGANPMQCHLVFKQKTKLSNFEIQSIIVESKTYNEIKESTIELLKDFDQAFKSKD